MATPKVAKKPSFLSTLRGRKGKKNEGSLTYREEATNDSEAKKREQDRKGIFSKRRRQSQELKDSGSTTTRKKQKEEEDAPFPGIALYTTDFANPKLKFEDYPRALTERREVESVSVSEETHYSGGVGAFMIPDEGSPEPLDKDADEEHKRDKHKKKGSVSKGKGKNSSTRRKKKSKSRRHLTEDKVTSNGHCEEGETGGERNSDEVTTGEGTVSEQPNADLPEDNKSDSNDTKSEPTGPPISLTDKLTTPESDGSLKTEPAAQTAIGEDPEENPSGGSEESTSSTTAPKETPVTVVVTSENSGSVANEQAEPKEEVEAASKGSGIREDQVVDKEKLKINLERKGSDGKDTVKESKEPEWEEGEEETEGDVLVVIRTVGGKGEGQPHLRVEARQKSSRTLGDRSTETFLLGTRPLTDEAEGIEAFLGDALQGVKEEDSAEPSRAKTKLMKRLSRPLVTNIIHRKNSEDRSAAPPKQKAVPTDSPVVPKNKYLFWLEVEDFKKQHEKLKQVMIQKKQQKLERKQQKLNSSNGESTPSLTNSNSSLPVAQPALSQDNKSELFKDEEMLSMRDLLDLASRLYHQYIAPNAVSRVEVNLALAQKLLREITSAQDFCQLIDRINSKESAASVVTIERYFDKIKAASLEEMRKEPMPFFLKNFIAGAMEVETLEKNCPLPHVVFEEFEREFSFSGSGWEAVMEEETDAEGVRCMRKFFEGQAYGCYACFGMVPAPAQQIFRLVQGLGKIRKKWEELYLEGRLLEEISDNMTLVRFAFRGINETLKRRDFVAAQGRGCVTASVKSMTKEVQRKTFVCFSQSVVHPLAPPHKNFIRGEFGILGWLIKETGFSSCLVTRIVLVDFQGQIPGNAVNLIAQKMSASAVVNLKGEVENIRERSMQLMMNCRNIYLPCVCKLHYQHNNITKTEWENSEGGGKIDNVQGDGDFINAKENDRITIIGKREETKWWVAYHNGKRGLFNLDFLDPSAVSLVAKKPEDRGHYENPPPVLMNPSLMALLHLILEQDLAFVFAILSVIDLTDGHAVADALIRVFEAGGDASHLIKTAISRDLAKKTTGGTLFRGTEIHTILLSVYNKSVGRKYLVRTLTKLIQHVVQLYSDNKSLEVDPAKLGNSSRQLNENIHNLVETSRQFLDRIINSLEYCPGSLRDICRHLQQEVSAKFPESKHSVVGGFFFLRFLCPAIVSPTKFGLVKSSISQEVHRGLILVSKVLQNLANGVEFGAKEAHMVTLNDFILENMAAVHAFFDNLTNEEDLRAALANDAKKKQTSVTLPREAIITLHIEISHNIDPIIAELEKHKTPSTATKCKRLLDTLVQLGPPETIQSPLPPKKKGSRISFSRKNSNNSPSPSPPTPQKSTAVRLTQTSDKRKDSFANILPSIDEVVSKERGCTILGEKGKLGKMLSEIPSVNEMSQEGVSSMEESGSSTANNTTTATTNSNSSSPAPRVVWVPSRRVGIRKNSAIQLEKWERGVARQMISNPRVRDLAMQKKATLEKLLTSKLDHEEMKRQLASIAGLYELYDDHYDLGVANGPEADENHVRRDSDSNRSVNIAEEKEAMKAALVTFFADHCDDHELLGSFETLLNELEEQVAGVEKLIQAYRRSGHRGSRHILGDEREKEREREREKEKEKDKETEKEKEATTQKNEEVEKEREKEKEPEVKEKENSEQAEKEKVSEENKETREPLVLQQDSSLAEKFEEKEQEHVSDNAIEEKEVKTEETAHENAEAGTDKQEEQAKEEETLEKETVMIEPMQDAPASQDIKIEPEEEKKVAEALEEEKREEHIAQVNVGADPVVQQSEQQQQLPAEGEEEKKEKDQPKEEQAKEEEEQPKEEQEENKEKEHPMEEQAKEEDEQTKEEEHKSHVTDEQKEDKVEDEKTESAEPSKEEEQAEEKKEDEPAKEVLVDEKVDTENEEEHPAEEKKEEEMEQAKESQEMSATEHAQHEEVKTTENTLAN